MSQNPILLDEPEHNISTDKAQHVVKAEDMYCIFNVDSITF